MKDLFLIILMFLRCTILSQNLIPNPSFEDTINDCHYQAWVSPGMPNVNMAKGWYMPTQGTPDLKAPSSICPYTGYSFGSGHTVAPSHGNYFVAFITHETSSGSDNYREYVGTKLISLLQNKRYCLKFDLLLMEGSILASNNIGVLLSSDSLYENKLTDLNIQPTFNIDTTFTSKVWKEVSVEVQALGNEQFIYFGNFYADSLTSTVVTSNSYPITFYCIDNLSLTLCPGQEEPDHFTIYPNPSNGNAIYIDKYADTTAQISLYNALGQQVGVRNLPAGAYKGAVFEQLASGVYVVVYVTASGYREEKKVVVI